MLAQSKARIQELNRKVELALTDLKVGKFGSDSDGFRRSTAPGSTPNLLASKATDLFCASRRINFQFDRQRHHCCISNGPQIDSIA
jgi:hypothetical protein